MREWWWRKLRDFFFWRLDEALKFLGGKFQGWRCRCRRRRIGWSLLLW